MLVFLIFIISASSYILSDLYLPAFPRLESSFHTSSTLIQYSFTIYLISLAFFQLIWGPVSDRIGRKKVILLCVLIVLLGTIICVFSTDVYIFLIGRFVQGIGSAALVVLTRAMARDLFSGVKLAQISSYQGLTNNIVTAASPVIGSYLILGFSWQSLFILILILFIVILFLTIKYLPETNINVSSSSVLSNYIDVLTHRTFLLGTIASASSFGGLMAYLAVVPFLYQKVLGISLSYFGWLGMVIILASLFVKLTNAKLVKKLGVKKMLFSASILTLVGAILMLIFVLIGFINVWVVLIPFLLFNAGAGLIFSNMSSVIMVDFKSSAGSASAVYGCIQILGSVIATAIIAVISEQTQLGLAIVLCALAIISAFCLFFIKWDK